LGNSIRNFCNALTLSADIPTLQERVDMVEEQRLTVECGQPGDFDKAFNDTYIIRGKGKKC